MTTESTLHDWRFGSTQAERLCAAILHTEGFDAVDPQCPLGGPDGRKDVLCEKGGRRFVAACYFPATGVTLPDVRAKLLHDAEGISKNDAEGLVFFVNQRVTPSERAGLAEDLGTSDLNLYHLERIRSILDSPKGYGIRLEHLRIAMTIEEQLSLHSVINFHVDERLKQHGRQLATITRILKRVRERTDDIAGQLLAQPSSLDQFADLNQQFPTAKISVGLLCWLHRVVTDNTQMPLANRGTIRTTEVWIGTGGGRENATFIPPAPEHIQSLLVKLLEDWQSRHQALIGASRDEIINALAEFHHRLLYIHPFLDGNGRIARIVLQQQVAELLQQWITAVFSKEPDSYYAALRQGDEGDLSSLSRLISANLE